MLKDFTNKTHDNEGNWQNTHRNHTFTPIVNVSVTNNYSVNVMLSISVGNAERFHKLISPNGGNPGHNTHNINLKNLPRVLS